MKCPSCGASVRDTDRFCPECGTTVASAVDDAPCRACGQMVPLGSKFCGNCGASEPHTAPAGATGETVVSRAPVRPDPLPAAPASGAAEEKPAEATEPAAPPRRGSMTPGAADGVLRPPTQLGTTEDEDTGVFRRMIEEELEATAETPPTEVRRGTGAPRGVPSDPTQEHHLGQPVGLAILDKGKPKPEPKPKPKPKVAPAPKPAPKAAPPPEPEPEEEEEEEEEEEKDWPDITEEVAEVKFFVLQGFEDDAAAALKKLIEKHGQHPELAVLDAELKGEEPPKPKKKKNKPKKKPTAEVKKTKTPVPKAPSPVKATPAKPARVDSQAPTKTDPPTKTVSKPAPPPKVGGTKPPKPPKRPMKHGSGTKWSVRPSGPEGPAIKKPPAPEKPAAETPAPEPAATPRSGQTVSPEQPAAPIVTQPPSAPIAAPDMPVPKAGDTLTSGEVPYDEMVTAGGQKTYDITQATMPAPVDRTVVAPAPPKPVLLQGRREGVDVSRNTLIPTSEDPDRPPPPAPFGGALPPGSTLVPGTTPPPGGFDDEPTGVSAGFVDTEAEPPLPEPPASPPLPEPPASPPLPTPVSTPAPAPVSTVVPPPEPGAAPVAETSVPPSVPPPGAVESVPRAATPPMPMAYGPAPEEGADEGDDLDVSLDIEMSTDGIELPVVVEDTGDVKQDRHLHAVPTTETVFAPAPLPPAPYEGQAPTTLSPAQTVRLVMLGSRGQTVAERTIRPGESLDVGRDPAQPWGDDEYLEDQHARITPAAGGGVLIDDYEGAGPVFRQVSERTVIRAGDQFRVGQSLIQYEAGEGGWGRLVVFINGEEPVKIHDLGGTGATLGREFGDITFLDDTYVSGEHCRFLCEGEDVYVEDLDSSNGTYVRVRRGEPVAFGALLLLGHTQFRVRPA